MSRNCLRKTSVGLATMSAIRSPGSPVSARPSKAFNTTLIQRAGAEASGGGGALGWRIAVEAGGGLVANGAGLTDSWWWGKKMPSSTAMLDGPATGPPPALRVTEIILRGPALVVSPNGWMANALTDVVVPGFSRPSG